MVSFDYPYLAEGRKRPDPLAQLVDAHSAALQKAREVHPGPVVLIGKSMGGRIGCHVALSHAVNAVVCLGYPLCGGGDREKLRDKVLYDLRTPILFVQGTRDSLCPLDLLEKVRARMQAPNELHVVNGGDHSLMVMKRVLKESGETQESVDAGIEARVREFIEGR